MELLQGGKEATNLVTNGLMGATEPICFNVSDPARSSACWGTGVLAKNVLA